MTDRQTDGQNYDSNSVRLTTPKGESDHGQLMKREPITKSEAKFSVAFRGVFSGSRGFARYKPQTNKS